MFVLKNSRAVAVWKPDAPFDRLHKVAAAHGVVALDVGHAGELRVLPQGVGLAVAAAGDYDAEANVLLTALAYTEHGLRVPALKEYGCLPRLAL